MRRALRIALLVLLLIVLGLPALLAWLIGTESGNAAVIARVAPLIGASIEIGERKGSIAGALEWRDLVYEDASVRVELKHLLLRWQPTRLWDRSVHVDELLGEGLVLRLKPKPDSGEPPITHLPVKIDVGHLALRDAQLWTQQATAPIVIRSADFTGHWHGTRVHVARLDVDYPDTGLVKLQGDARLREDGVDLKRLAILAPALIKASGFIGYQSENDLQLSWEQLRWPLPGVLGAVEDAPPIASSARGEATLKGLWSDLQFKLDAALGEQGQTQIEGRWNGQLDAKAHWTDLAWPLVKAADGAPAPYRSARGALTFKGLPQSYGFGIDADLLARDQAGHVRAKGSGSTQAVDLEFLRVNAGKASLEAAGPVAWAPQPSGALHGQIRQLDPALFAPGWPGNINGEFAIEGEQAQKGAKPSLQFKLDLRDSRLRNYPLKLNAVGRYAEDVLQLDSLELHSGESVLTASGRASEPYDLQAQLVSLNMAELAPALAGTMQAKVHLRGRLAQPQISADADLARASWKDYALTALQLKLDFDWNGPLSLDVTARELSVGTRVQTLDLSARGSRKDHQIKLKAATHDLDTELALSGGYDERLQTWKGQLANADLTPAKLSTWRLEAPVDLSLSPKQNDLANGCWLNPPGRVCLEAHQNPKLTQAALQIENLRFASLQSWLPGGLKLDGALSGQASAEIAAGVVRKAQAELNTTAGSAEFGDRRFGFKPARLSIQDAPEEGRAHLSLPLDVGGIEADARFAPGSVLMQRGLSGEVRLDFPDLAFLSVLSTEVSSASGHLSGRYSLAGRVGAPELQGEAHLSEGRIKLTRPGIELTEVDALVSGEPGGRVKVLASAKSGEGQIKIEGMVENRPASGSGEAGKEVGKEAGKETAQLVVPPAAEVASNSTAAKPGSADPPSTEAPPPPPTVVSTGQGGFKVALNVRGEDFLVAKLPVAQVWISPDLNFDLQGKAATLKGTLTVPRADIRLKQSADNGVAPSSDQVIVNSAGERPVKEESFKLASEVKLVLGRKVELEGYGLKTRLEGEVTAVDQPGRETLGYGELRLEEGRYKAYGQDLEIETGKLSFNGGPITKPGMEVRAVRRPTDEVKVGIYVRGTLERPQLTLYSEPTMTQQQQLSWLLLGQPLEQSSTSQDRNALSGAAVALGLGGGSALAQNFQKGLGLDQISLGSDPGETNEQARLTVGKYLSPKIFVSYGVGLFQPGQVFKLLYDLGRGFKLSTESGTYTGGDLLYSVERR